MQNLTTTEYSEPQYVIPTPDISRAHPETAAALQKYFDAKNTHSVENFMAHFAKDMIAYGDATLGWIVPGWQVVYDTLVSLMPNWGTGRSYPTRILAGRNSAIVAMTDTPELFGGEIHALACVDLRDDVVVRWVDVWDSKTFDPSIITALTAHVQFYPLDFGETEIESSAELEMAHACKRLHAALVNADTPLASLFAYDAVYEDMAARVQLIGRSTIAGFLDRVLEIAPFGPGAKLRHIVGGKTGGGYEWTGAAKSGVPRGVTALELDETGRISRLTTVYDSVRFGEANTRRLRDAVDG
ncbi:hypothetical protein A6U85_25350 [Agrobacterium sp. 13-626]|nr:hypothetical protein A6U85_25350 [Agrobacterium sp. 13-626]